MHPFSFVFLCLPPSFDKMTERVINHWKVPVATHPHPLHWQAHTHIHIYAEENSNSSFKLHGPISMTRAPRIRVKNCHSSAFVGAPWFRRTPKNEGTEQSSGLERRNMGQLECLGGEMEECVNDHLEDQSISIVQVWCWGGVTPKTINSTNSISVTYY